MSEAEPVDCEGAPRDLGLDQGTACAAEVASRARAAGARRLYVGAWRPHDRDRVAREADRALGRDLRRHFPHLAERLAGLARGARVPEAALVHLLARVVGLRPGEGGVPGIAVGRHPGRGGRGGGGLAVRVPAGGIVRRARPDTGFAALEWTLPWLPGALAGVNAAGLSGAVVPGVGGDGASAPATLLLQGCLQQFASAASAVEWCERRPAGGRAELFFADAAGAAVGLSVDGAKRTPLAPPDGPASDARLALDPLERTLALGATKLALPAATKSG